MSKFTPLKIASCVSELITLAARMGIENPYNNVCKFDTIQS
jgi:hypothetical protein